MSELLYHKVKILIGAVLFSNCAQPILTPNSVWSGPLVRTPWSHFLSHSFNVHGSPIDFYRLHSWLLVPKPHQAVLVRKPCQVDVVHKLN